MDDVTDLVKWLREQLDEDERIARAATPGPWYRHDAYLDVGGHTATVLSGEPGRSDLRAWLPTRRGDVYWDKGRNVWNDAAYIAQHNPARALAEVDAKRRIMAIHHPRKFEGMGGLPQICDGCGYGGICDDPITEDINDCPILRVLALPYADRPGYREDWRP